MKGLLKLYKEMDEEDTYDYYDMFSDKPINLMPDEDEPNPRKPKAKEFPTLPSTTSQGHMQRS